MTWYNCRFLILSSSCWKIPHRGFLLENSHPRAVKYDGDTSLNSKNFHVLSQTITCIPNCLISYLLSHLVTFVGISIIQVAHEQEQGILKSDKPVSHQGKIAFYNSNQGHTQVLSDAREHIFTNTILLAINCLLVHIIFVA